MTAALRALRLPIGIPVFAWSLATLGSVPQGIELPVAFGALVASACPIASWAADKWLGAA